MITLQAYLAPLNFQTEEINALNKTIAVLTNEKANLQSVILDLEGQLDTKQLRVDQLTDEVNLLNSRLEELQEEIQSYENTISDKNNEIAILTNDKTILQTQVDDAQLTIQEQATQINSKNLEIENLNTTISGMNENQSALQNQITGLENDKNTLQSQLTEQGELITEKNNTITQLNSQINDLMEQLENAGDSEELENALNQIQKLENKLAVRVIKSEEFDGDGETKQMRYELPGNGYYNGVAVAFTTPHVDYANYSQNLAADSIAIQTQTTYGDHSLIVTTFENRYNGMVNFLFRSNSTPFKATYVVVCEEVT